VNEVNMASTLELLANIMKKQKIEEQEHSIRRMLVRIRSNETLMSAILGSLFFVMLALVLSGLSRSIGAQLHDFYSKSILEKFQPEVLKSLPTTVRLNALPLRYIVQKGDSTWKIAEAFYGSPYNYIDVEKENNLVPDQQLIEGTVLMIPKAAVRPQPVGDKNQLKTYRTTASDTLWKLAQRFYNNGYAWTKIYDANKKMIKNPNVLETGTLLVIPQ